MNKVKTNTKKSFWKFIYFPLWETEKKQKLIEEYAENGYMLTKVWGNLFYKFRKRSPKKVKCFISNYKLRRGFNLAPISDFWFYWKTRDLNSCELIFDFDNYSEEFEKYYREINLWRDYVYHPRYMIENVCFALVFLLFSVLLITKEPVAVGGVLSGILIAMLSLTAIVYNVVGLVSVHRRYKSLEEGPPYSMPMPDIKPKKKSRKSDYYLRPKPKKKKKKKRYQYEK